VCSALAAQLGRWANKNMIIRFLGIISSFIFGFSQYSFSEMETVYLPTFGPAIHYNIGSKQNYFSFSFEFSVWKFKKSESWDLFFPDSISGPYNGINIGFEYSRLYKRIYSEVQMAAPFFGLSLGPVAEKAGKKDFGFGIQGSAWGCIIGGIDLRYRYVNQKNSFCPGIMLKI
jgi:hypothetical protein